eukprot:scaffold2093_cov425-Prasinococcus_capsulatus_cf.AAC.12
MSGCSPARTQTCSRPKATEPTFTPGLGRQDLPAAVWTFSQNTLPNVALHSYRTGDCREALGQAHPENQPFHP